MDERCRREVIELHQFFEEWFTAKRELTEENFLRFSRVMGTGFEIISPDGDRRGREEMVENLRNAHGVYREETFRIWIEGYRSRPLAEGLQLVTYEEWQERADGKRGRLSTAVLRRNPDTPNGVEWLHVHEVWLPSRQGR